MLSLNDYGLIGNLHTAALVSRDGSVDWACLPRFASPSVFARILDDDRGGHATIRPVEPYRAEQSYLPSSCVLRTEFRLADGRRLELTDFFPVLEHAGPEGAPLIVRQLEAFGGAVAVTGEFLPAFEYGTRPHAWSTGRRRAVARCDHVALEVTTELPLRVHGPVAALRTELSPEVPATVEIAWGRRPKGLAPPDELLSETLQYWQEWAHGPGSEVHHVAERFHRWILRSELTLKLLSHSDTGAFVAAPTTSLPEAPGGVRNWDYRYVWIRDAAFAAQTMLKLGHPREAHSFLRWVLLRLRDDPNHRLRVVYGAHGERDLTERELPHLRGLWDSRPVRVGNGAARQFQLDIYGELLDAAVLLDRVEPGFVSEHWPEIASLANVVLRRWREPDRGIWEVRGPPQQFVHSKLMAWVALDRAAELARRHGTLTSVSRWTNEAQKIRAWILTEGFDPRHDAFRQAAGTEAPDAANLRIPLVGFLPYDDPAVLGTVDQVRRELADGPFVYRYRTPDGLPGAEGAFLPASFWLVECLARAGRTELAEGAWQRLVRSGNGLDLFSEEYAPETATMLGNFPQALTHIALLRAAIALGEEADGRARPEQLGTASPLPVAIPAKISTLT